jgi:very-short-patch-repair endonuclease
MVGQHYEDENIKKDLQRTAYFARLGINVKRYTNIDIKTNLSGTMNDLLEFFSKYPLLDKERVG